MALPRFVRQFAFDAVKGALAGLILLNIAIPGSLNESGAAALVAGSAAIRVAITATAEAFTMAVPAFLAWLLVRLDLEDLESEG
jgi:hypothetical protein